MGGHQVPEQGPRDDGYDDKGYDESQRAEILEATREGPHDDTMITDLEPDLGDEDDDLLEMTDGEVGEEDVDSSLTAQDRDEDEQQSDFDDGDADAIEP